MKNPVTASPEFWIIALGLPALILISVFVSLWRLEDRHKYWASCDARGPHKYCEDYYYDGPNEVECTKPVKLMDTRCDRAKVIGGCRSKGMIKWFYQGSTDPEATSKKCSSSQWVPADWKEAEEK